MLCYAIILDRRAPVKERNECPTDRWIVTGCTAEVTSGRPPKNLTGRNGLGWSVLRSAVIELSLTQILLYINELSLTGK